MKANKAQQPSNPSVRAARTRQAILAAFRQMVIHHAPGDINVKALAELAGIHRKTFYLHYAGIEELREDLMTTVSRAYRDEVAKLGAPFDYYRLSRVFIDFYTRDEFVEKLVSDSRYADLYHTISARTLRENRRAYNPFEDLPEEEQELVNAFMVGASNIVFRRWVAGGKKVKPQRLAQMLGDLLEHGVEGLLTGARQP